MLLLKLLLKLTKIELAAITFATFSPLNVVNDEESFFLARNKLYDDR